MENMRAILVAHINICAAPELKRAYLALGPYAATERAHEFATKTLGMPEGSAVGKVAGRPKDICKQHP